MSRIRLVVTAEDIAATAPITAHSCPLAIALRRQGFPEACVANGGWRVRHGSDVWFHFSDTLRQFTRRFDAGRPVKPHTFLIEGPTPTEVPT